MSTIEREVMERTELARRIAEREAELDGLRSQLAEWEAEYAGTPKRDGPFTTASGTSVEPLYTSLDRADADPEAEGLGVPGRFPFTRGPYPTMYRTRLWTMRQFAGFATAEETNERYHYLLEHGQTGLSVAFDFPTLMGFDSDHPRSLGEVGVCGVAISSLRDMETLFDGIPLDQVSVSMTINGPAAILFCFYVVAAERQGVSAEKLRGTVQNDILKEYQAQHAWVFPPDPALRLIIDMFAWCSQNAPKYNPISISGYHIREAGATAAEELAFTLRNGFEYVERAVARGLDVDEFAPRLSFFFDVHNDFFEEVAKFRAARRIWARRMRDVYGAKDPDSWRLRTHAQTAGVTLTAQQPENNIVRVAYQALAAVLGGTQSLHTNSMDETLALPTEKAARIALRTQQVLAHETRVTNVADPLGGSWYVEELTDEMERRASAVFDHLDELGGGSVLEGVLQAVEGGWFQREIADAAYELERKVNDGRHVVVGVTDFFEGNDDAPPEILRIGPEVEEAQLKRLATVRADRDDDAVQRSLAAVRAVAAEPTANVMPALVDAVQVYASVGEITNALADVLGRYTETPVI